MRRGDIWWAALPEPNGSGPGFTRPVVVVQADSFNASRIGTVVVATVSSNLRLADAPGNVFLDSRESALPKDSVVNVSQLVTLDRSMLTEFVSALSEHTIRPIDEGLALVLDL